jgi:hypothetical protein
MNMLYGHGEHHEHRGCGCEEHHRRHGQHDEPGCGCEEPHPHHGRHAGPGPAFGGGFHRIFMTRAEQMERLEAYLRELEAEAQAVKERIDSLKAEAA